MTHANIATSTAPFFHDHNLIEVLAYSFSAYNQSMQSFTAHKVFLDILFQHPRTAETITLRTIVPAHLLCSSKEDVEGTVYREIRKALSFQTAGMS